MALALNVLRLLLANNEDEGCRSVIYCVEKLFQMPEHNPNPQQRLL